MYLVGAADVAAQALLRTGLNVDVERTGAKLLTDILLQMIAERMSITD